MRRDLFFCFSNSDARQESIPSIRQRCPLRNVRTSSRLTNEANGDMFRYGSQVNHSYVSLVSNSLAFIIRVDGVSFHTFTKGLKGPMDSRLTRCMVKTTIDLVEKFNAITGYHQSDEISIVFAAANDAEEVAAAAAKAELEAAEPAKKKQRKKAQVLKNHPYNGRVQKLASVAASYASSRLNYHLMQEGMEFISILTN
jgi:hypothetical protein